jgi:hypothetical protein
MSHRSLHVHSACGDYDVLRGPKPPGVMLTAVNAPSHHLSLCGSAAALDRIEKQPPRDEVEKPCDISATAKPT